MKSSQGSTIDFNCDLGEGCGDDAAIARYISSASIACGVHAGDRETMRRTVVLCRDLGVAIGAHPSLDDREGFGRQERPTGPDLAYDLVLAQVRDLAAICQAEATRLRHVKPHGALYNMAARDPVLAEAVAHAVRDVDPSLRLFGLSGSALPAAGEAAGLAVAHEVFAERRYEADGSLTPRSREGAILDGLEQAVEQALRLVREGAVIARTGERVSLRADTLCLHGDRPDAAAFARALRAALDAAGVRVEAFGEAA